MRILIIMRLIAHRGNINGPNPYDENYPNHITYVLGLDLYDVEIDVWYIDDEFWLGHDEAQYKVEEEFLENVKLWCHAKNIVSFARMLQNDKIHCFFHQNDDCTLTSNKFVWTFPGQKLTDNSICVMPERTNDSFLTDKYICNGICSDYVAKFNNKN
jgi:hypothetical protein